MGIGVTIQLRCDSYKSDVAAVLTIARQIFLVVIGGIGIIVVQIYCVNTYKGTEVLRVAHHTNGDR